MNHLLLTKDVQKFISEVTSSEVKTLALKKSPFENITSAELAQQADGRLRSEKKLPTWFKTAGIYYPVKLSIEQSSSELTARYKSKLAKKGVLVDLTGGFGVDTFYFSKVTDETIHCETDAELSEIAKHNSQYLGAVNIRFYNGDGIDYLKSLDKPIKNELLQTATNNTPESSVAKKCDTIYIDPSRRIKTQKVFRLADCEPDIIKNMDLLLEKSSRLIIKTSPLLDTQSGLKELRNVASIHILSIKNDCKELVWVIDKDFGNAGPEIVCAALSLGKEETYQFRLSDEKKTLARFSLPRKYIYEPDVALLKAGAFKLICKDFDLQKLHQHTHLYTSEDLKEFIGKIFELIDLLEYKQFVKTKPVSKANIICRNFPHTPEQVKKRLKIEDGGDIYLFFITTSDHKLNVLICKRIK